MGGRKQPSTTKLKIRRRGKSWAREPRLVPGGRYCRDLAYCREHVTTYDSHNCSHLGFLKTFIFNILFVFSFFPPKKYWSWLGVVHNLNRLCTCHYRLGVRSGPSAHRRRHKERMSLLGRKTLRFFYSALGQERQ